MTGFSPKYIILYVFTFLISHFIPAQSKTEIFLTPSDTLNKQRRNAVIISEAALGTGALIGLNQLWYSDYEQSKFQSHYKIPCKRLNLNQLRIIQSDDSGGHFSENSHRNRSEACARSKAYGH